jgi:pyridinium-3,5-biscarboxylic acid mononucleotide sulfurtransferase
MDRHRQGRDRKYSDLQEILRNLQGVLVAFSGGVDSTLLLKVAKDTLGDKVLAVTAQSETTPSLEMSEARKLAEDMGVEHLVVESRELELPEFVDNPPDKCYFCKKIRLGHLVELARGRGFAYVVDGTNSDDHRDHRPGGKASRELGIRSPLREALLSKSDIRLLSKKLQLPTWNRQSNACLASRIPYGHPITREKLRQVDAGEMFIRGLGLTGQVRVRHYGDLARLEVDAKNLRKIVAKRTREEINLYFRELGFQFVTLDLEGYFMGSLNRVIP